jgi:hypothetical protein
MTQLSVPMASSRFLWLMLSVPMTQSFALFGRRATVQSWICGFARGETPCPLNAQCSLQALKGPLDPAYRPSG